MVTSVLIGFKVRLQEIRKEENLKDYKHDKKFDQDNQPNLLAPARKV
jgi:hypothetical protein